MEQELLERMLLGNSVRAYLQVVAILLVGLVAVGVLRLVLRRLFRQPRGGSSAERGEAAERGGVGQATAGLAAWLTRVVLPLLYLGVVYLALTSLSMGARVEQLLRGAVAVVVTVVVVKSLLYGIEGLLRRGTDRFIGEEGERRIRPLRSLFAMAVWAVAAVFLLDNLGFDISAVVAGLGVSGIAVAIAAQGILGDLFNYFVILFDRPFEVGDFIIFDDKLGSVEKIGVKTTRIRALGGEELVVANSNLAGVRLHNYMRMQQRRVVFTFGVTYGTSSELLREIPALVQEIVEEQPQARFDRSHFQKYGDSALIFEQVYYVLGADYRLYMDIQQEINLRIFEAFEQRGIDFAYPTRTVHLYSDSKLGTNMGEAETRSGEAE